MKSFLESKTIWVSIVLAILPPLLDLFTPEVLESIGVTNPYVLSALAVLFGWLRTITKTPLKFK